MMKYRSGFTLIEVVIGIGILAVILAFGLFVTMDFYRRYAFHYEKTLIVSLLERARSQALANIDQKSHGLCRSGDKYILFAGSNCVNGTNKVETPGSSVVTIMPSNFEVVFNQLSARVSGAPITLKVKDTSSNQSSEIIIYEEGGIEY